MLHKKMKTDAWKCFSVDFSITRILKLSQGEIFLKVSFPESQSIAMYLALRLISYIRSQFDKYPGSANSVTLVISILSFDTLLKLRTDQPTYTYRCLRCVRRK